MKFFLICTLFILSSCAPILEQSTVKTQKDKKDIEYNEPTDISKLENLIVLLDKKEISQRLFYKEFINSSLINETKKKSNFIMT